MSLVKALKWLQSESVFGIMIRSYHICTVFISPVSGPTQTRLLLYSCTLYYYFYSKLASDNLALA